MYVSLTLLETSRGWLWCKSLFVGKVPSTIIIIIIIIIILFVVIIAVIITMFYETNL